MWETVENLLDVLPDLFGELAKVTTIIIHTGSPCSDFPDYIDGVPGQGNYHTQTASSTSGVVQSLMVGSTSYCG